MQIPVIIEKLAHNGFRARTGEPFALTAEGSSGADALDKLRIELQSRLRAGVQVATLEIPVPENPWLSFQGLFDPNDPLVQIWKETMAENRRKADAQPE